MASVFVPVIYVIVVFGSLFLFSHFYRKRSASKTFEPYFPSHPERNAYVTLLQRTDPPAHDALLKSALVRRAMADVTRVVRLREDKPALQNLLQKGSIGDELWNSLLAAEKELEVEIMEVVAEANTFVEGWGSLIFQTANEMIANEKLRGAFDQTMETRAEYELKYERKSKYTNVPPSLSLPSIPPSVQASALSAQSHTPSSKPNDSLIPPGAGAESAVSSDGEPFSSPTPSGTPRTPSKSSTKKGKKRK